MRNIFALCLLLGAFLLINAVRVEAQITVPASLDPALNGAGSGVAWAAGTTNVNPARVSASALQPQDGKIIIAGGFNRFNGTPQGCIARLNSDGSLDGTFNVGGAGIGPLTQGWGTISAMVRQPDGKLIIGGFFSTYNGTAVNNLARLNANGSLDGTFTGSLGANASIIGMALQPDGKIIIAGNFSTYSGTTVKGLARLNSDGSLDGTFNVGTGLQRAGLAIGWSLAVQPDGKIIVGGLFKTYNGTSRNSLARLNSDGSLDNTFNIGTGVQTDQVLDKEGIVTGIAVQPDSKLIIVGEFKTYNGIKANNIARVNADGSMDTAFTDSSLLTPGTDSLVNTVVLQPDGKILIGGIFLGYNNRLRPILARINSNGTIDDTFDTSGSGVGLNERVESILVQPDGKIFVGGMFTQYDTTALPVGVARFLPATGGLIAFDGDVPPFFSQSVFSVNEGVSNAAITLKRQLGNDGRTVAQVTFGSGSATANDFSFPSVGALDLSFNYGSGKGANNVVNALVIQPDGKIVIGGNFTAYNGDPNASDGILRLNKDGTIDTTFNYGAGNGTLGSVNAVVIEPSGKILIGGNFTSYNGDASASDNILRLNANGTLDTTFNYGAGFGADATVNAIILQPDGKVIVGGDFTSYNSDNSASDKVLRLNPDGALDKVFFNYGAGKGANANVRALALQTDGKILVGGDFNAYNGDAQTSRCIMRLSALGELDTSFNYGLNMGADFAVRAMVLQPDGKIIIGGDFFAYNQDAAANDRVARLNSNGSLDASFNYGLGRGADNPVFALALQPDGKVVIGGSFSSYSGDQNAGNRVLRLNTVGAIDTSFNYGSPTLGANGNVNALASRGDGKTVIGGAFSSYNGDPNAGDFVAQVGGEFLATWESGDFSVKTVLIPINDDSIEESTENRELVPSIVFGNSLISDISKPGLKKEAILFIGDNDLTISLVSGSGLVSGAATLTAKLTKNGLGLNNKTVNFSINGTAFGQATTNSSGVATFSGGTLSGINVGNYPNAVSANFAGDATFGVNSATGPLSVDKGNQTITLLPLADRPFNAPDFTVSATASSGLPVSFGVIGNCTIGGPQTNTVHLMGVLGSCTVVAAQIGDTNYNAQ